MTLNKLKPGQALHIYALVKRLVLQVQDTYKDMYTSKTPDQLELLDVSLEDKHIGKQHRELLLKLLTIAKRMENSLKLEQSQLMGNAQTYSR